MTGEAYNGLTSSSDSFDGNVRLQMVHWDPNEKPGIGMVSKIEPRGKWAIPVFLLTQAPTHHLVTLPWEPRCLAYQMHSRTNTCQEWTKRKAQQKRTT